jgi:hypothetical protein
MLYAMPLLSAFCHTFHPATGISHLATCNLYLKSLYRLDQSYHILNCALHPGQDCTRYDTVTDAELIDFRNAVKDLNSFIT